jgi:hypothetical protein
MIRTTLAAVALSAAAVAPAVPAATSAANAATARASCAERISNNVRLLPNPGYYQVTIPRACGSTGVQPEVKCWNNSTFIEVFGAKIRHQGYKSKASCTSVHPRLTKAWAHIGRTQVLRIFP